MAKTKISEFSATANSNTDINSINIAEGCAPSNINDAIRELMAELKDFQAGTKGDSFNGPVGTSTAAAGAFTTLSSAGNTTLGDASGDTVTINGTTTFANVNPTLSAGTANGVLYLNGSKVATSGSALTFDGTSLVAGASAGAGQNVLRTYTLGGYATIYNGAVTPNANNYVLAHNALQTYLNGNDFTGFSIAGSEAMRLTSTGLGIGTSSPVGRLSVIGSDNTTQAVFSGAIGTTGRGLRIATSLIASNNEGAILDAQATTGSATLIFQTASTERARIDSSGNMGIGGTNDMVGLAVQTPSYTTAYAADLGSNASVAGYGSQLQVISPSDSSTVSGISLFTRTTGRSRWDILNVWTGTFLGDLVFRRRNGGTSTAEAMRIDSSGNLLVGTTSADIIGAQTDGATFRYQTSGLLSVNKSGGVAINVGRSTSTGTLVNFYYNAAVKGTISTDGSTTAYNTSSDYRLKENIQPMTGALAKIQALKPCTYNWKADGSAGEGFIAHELAEVVPQCVTGAKDAVDADGNPVYQGIDTSFLVATLTAAIQELKAEFDAYKATHP